MCITFFNNERTTSFSGITSVRYDGEFKLWDPKKISFKKIKYDEKNKFGLDADADPGEYIVIEFIAPNGDIKEYNASGLTIDGGMIAISTIDGLKYLETVNVSDLVFYIKKGSLYNEL